MCNRIVGIIAASAIAAAALVIRSLPNRADSDVKVGDQATPSEAFEQKTTTSVSPDEMTPTETVEI